MAIWRAVMYCVRDVHAFSAGIKYRHCILHYRIEVSRSRLRSSLDNQTKVDSKPAGQPEHASLHQCQLIAANGPKLMLWAPPAGGGDKVSL